MDRFRNLKTLKNVTKRVAALSKDVIKYLVAVEL